MGWFSTKSWSIYFAIFFVLLFTPSFARADVSLLINEVYYDTTGTDSLEEWFELYNAGDTPIDLEDYYFSSGSEEYTVPEELVIEPEGFLVLAKNEDGFFALYGKAPDHIYSELSFGNAGDYLALYNKSDILADAIVWESGDLSGTVAHGGVKTGESLERKETGIDTDNCALDFDIVPDPIPWEKYAPPVYSDKIIISEISPSPEEGSDFEFIELFNSGSETVDLSGWFIDDIADGGSSPYKIPADTMIEPGEYLTFSKTSTKISLNDDGDIARLVKPNNEELSSIDYEKGGKGQSYSLIDSVWTWTLNITPASRNVLVLPQLADVEEEETVGENIGGEISILPIEEARKQENKVEVSVEGKVTALPGVLSTMYFYIEDSTGGIQIYLYDRDFPDLRVGDFVQVRGELSESNDERRIKVSNKTDITVLERTDEKIEPSSVAIEDIGEDKEGTYIKIVGEVSRTSGNIFMVKSSDGKAEVKIVIRETTDIDKPKMKKGDKIQVAGIVSQYKEEYRILPIDQEDVIILTSGDLPRAGPREGIYLVIIMIGAVWILSPIIKQRLIKSPPNLPKH